MHNRTLLLLLAAVLSATPTSLAKQPQTSPATDPLSFEVATIKPSKAVSWRLQPTPDGYTGMGISLRNLVQEAYGVYDNRLLTGGPAWVDSAKFDIEAKFDVAQIPKGKSLSYRERANMLQPLLAERFGVRVHHDMRQFPVYNLVLAKGGSKLKSTAAMDEMGIGITCHVIGNRSGFTQRQDCEIGSLNDLLAEATRRFVVNKTGLAGRYDLELRWTPENVAPGTEAEYSGPSIFTAVQEQLGLKLEPATAPLDVLVIDRADRPTEN